MTFGFRRGDAAEFVPYTIAVRREDNVAVTIRVEPDTCGNAAHCGPCYRKVAETSLVASGLEPPEDGQNDV